MSVKEGCLQILLDSVKQILVQSAGWGAESVESGDKGPAVCGEGLISAAGPSENCSGVRVSGATRRAAVSRGLLHSNNPGG